MKQEPVKPLILISLLTFLNGFPCALRGPLGGVAELCGRDFYARRSIPAHGAAALGTRGWRGGGGRAAPTVPTLDLGVPGLSTSCCAPLARLRPSEDTGLRGFRGCKGAFETLDVTPNCTHSFEGAGRSEGLSRFITFVLCFCKGC